MQICCSSAFTLFFGRSFLASLLNAVDLHIMCSENIDKENFDAA